MISESYPKIVLLHQVGGQPTDMIRNFLSDRDILFYEAADPTQIGDAAVIDHAAVAIAASRSGNLGGIHFLRTMMQLNTWTQRLLIVSSFSPADIELAVNKAHINYLLHFPFDEETLQSYLLKANKRFLQLNKSFKRIDALANLTENLLLDNEKYRLEANTDSLTQLMNRRSFNSIIRRFWKRFEESRIPFSMALLDLDDFKLINDNHGHTAGDAVLKKFSQILAANQRLGIDYAFRYGGEEFAVISSNTRADDMAAYMERLINIIRETQIEYRGRNMTVTFSAGVSQAIQSESAELMISKADSALYLAKAAGKNCVRIAGRQ